MCLRRSGWIGGAATALKGVVGAAEGVFGIVSNWPEAVRLGWRFDDGPVGTFVSGVGGRGISRGVSPASLPSCRGGGPLGMRLGR
jgi:hypothetical protein